MTINTDHVALKIIRSGLLSGTLCLLLTSCFMESVTPITSIEQASYPTDLLDTWSMLDSNETIYLIEAENKHQLKITFKRQSTTSNDIQISYAHISYIDGTTFINNKTDYGKLYEFYKFDRPCKDLILIYAPNPEQIDHDITSGRLKGRIVQDFFTSRIIDESQINMAMYLKRYQQELFIPFQYLVRQSQATKLSTECKIKIKPVPGEPKNKPHF